MTTCNSRRRLVLTMSAMALPGLAFAQAFPSRALKLIVPFPPGGPADLFARVLANEMSRTLGQPVVIENKGGVGGVLGVELAVKAPADGYTLALNSASTVAILPYSLPTMPYDVDKDVAYLTMVVRVPEVLAIHPSVPVNTLQELVRHAQANPGKLTFGSAGTGSITHLAVELLKAEAKVDMVHVPYKGAAPAVADLVAGHVQLAIFDVPVLLPHIQAGRLKAIAVTSANRAASLPAVPTTAEGGFPTVMSDNWYGLVAPAGTAPAVLDKIRDAAVAALKTADVAEKYASVSGVPAPSTTQEYLRFVADEQAKWSKIIKANALKQ